MLMFRQQELMNRVYNEWRKEENKGFDRLSLIERKFTPVHKVAVQLGNFNYQVENGGFSQWHCNRYCAEDINDILKYCTIAIEQKIEHSEELYKIVEDVHNAYNKVFTEQHREIVCCDECGGTGEYEHNEECSICDGTGSIEGEQCEDCDGTGTKTITDSCCVCGGDGEITLDEDESFYTLLDELDSDNKYYKIKSNDRFTIFENIINYIGCELILDRIKDINRKKEYTIDNLLPIYNSKYEVDIWEKEKYTEESGEGFVLFEEFLINYILHLSTCEVMK